MSPVARSRRLGAAIVLTVLLAVSLAAGWLVADSLRIATHMPVQLNYVDGYMVDDTLRLARGEPLYPDPAAGPYTVTVYTPGFFALGAILVRLGVDGFAAGRLLALISMLALVVIVAWSGFRHTGWVAVLVGLALLLHPLQWPWSLVIRPDFTAIVLSVLAVVVATGKPNHRGIVFSAMLCVAAVLTKQTAVAAPAAIAVGLLAADRRAAIRFTAVFASATLASVVGLQWITHGQFFFHTVTANANPFALDRAIALYRRFIESSPLVVVVLGVMLIASGRRRRLSTIAIYALLCLVTASAVGKIGSSMNYFLEPLVALALWTAHEFPTTWFARREPMRTAVATLGVVAVLLFSVASWIDQMRAHHVARSAIPLHAELVRTVAAEPDPVVSDDATLLVGAGKRVHYRPFIMAQLADAGRWDQTPFLKELDEGAVSMIIHRNEPVLLHESRYTRPMRNLMALRYRQAFSYRLGSSFVVLRPVADGNTAEPNGGGGE